ncbi:MAG TPA: glycoside hydrolase family 130 protein [Cyclobacteriaceae bacterium]|nr:glycoside hydrolase family 130 protein [Cyclobacteriaceae bacterium]
MRACKSDYPVYNFSRVLHLAFFIMFLGACAPREQEPDWTMVPFAKADTVNPVLQPLDSSRFVCPVRGSVVHWERKDVFNPAAVVKDNKVFLLYRAEDTVGRHAGTSRIGLAESTDGLHFVRRPEPVLFPREDAYINYEWEGGCEDPRIVEDGRGTYYMTYTAYDGNIARLLIASSHDLITWKKHGAVFRNAHKGKFVNKWTKSGAIVTRLENGRLVAARIGGKYWMYFGDTHIFAATSDNMVEWTPLITEDGKDFLPIFSPREGMFDSDLVEPGPPAMVTDKGILLLYNARNHPEKGDPDLPAGTYTAGQVLLDPNDPTHVLDRTDEYFFRPTQSYEITGQVNNVCFLEGLVFFKDRWLLYYGTADSKIAVATYAGG